MERRELLKNAGLGALGLGLAGSAIGSLDTVDSKVINHVYIGGRISENVLKESLGEEVYTAYNRHSSYWFAETKEERMRILKSGYDRRLVSIGVSGKPGKGGLSKCLAKMSEIAKEYHEKYGVAYINSHACWSYNQTTRVLSCDMGFHTEKIMDSNAKIFIRNFA